MEVFALNGKSGTGKSTSALYYAFKHDIPAIIDDGLLIYHGKKVAGTSAKYEKNYIQAVKRAILFYDDHAKEIQDALQNYKIKKILIIGTSIKMLNRIVQALQLKKIDHIIHVSEIRSSSEIKMALFVRKTQGKHVIPIPHIEVKPNVFKKLVSRGKKVFSNQELIGETTIVQPNFQTGSIQISEQVIKKIAQYSISPMKDIKQNHGISIDFNSLPTIKIQLELFYPLTKSLIEVIKDIQEKLHEDFSSYLSIELSSIDIKVMKLTMDGKR